MFSPPDIVLKFTPAREDRPWEVIGDHLFSTGHVTVTVPHGFRTDLASIPNALAFLYDPAGRHQQAAVFHDYLYATRKVRRFEADAIFRVAMIDSGVAKWRALTMYYAVRMFGWLAWGKRNGANS